ncbi:MAG: sigma 54-interacting transcriptional regulator [Polyangiaceae bacterium]|jgi:transcriptional regulator with GAF, ATPase, and Fis domain
MLKLVVVRGALSGQTLSSSADAIRIGRAEGNDFVIPDEHVSSEHARIALVGDRIVLRDLRSTNGTWVVRGEARSSLSDVRGREMTIEQGDVIELGSGDKCVAMQVVVDASPDARVFALRRIEDLAPATTIVEKDEGRLKLLYEAQKAIGAATDLSEVFAAIAEACFDLVQKASHVTVVLKDDEDDASKGSSAYVPVMTRVRGQSGPPSTPVPVTRSIYRKVVTERAAVLAADATSEVSQSESLMGTQIRATMGIPLWKGDDILGILQVDNRSDAGVFSPGDLEILAVLAHNVSLAVANARLVRRLKNAEDRLKKENAFLKGREETRRSGGKGQVEIIGQSAPMKSLSHQLDKVVDTRVTVLIEGETGVGKELVASAVHYRSRRRDKLFISQNCAAMPENLLESELFGHKKGSFTGAHEEKKGLFEIADGGTLFLDEVTEMPLSLQSKLLRALQEGEIRPVGSTTEKRVDVRIVAATNRNLEKEVAEGRFREDLYYRLKVFPIRVPPLRERREDIPLIAEHFLLRFSSEFGKPAAGFTQQAMELLQGYDWPGNVRELQNEVQRLCIQVEPGGFVTPDLLSPRVRQVEGMLDRVKPTKGTLKEMMDQVERWLLIESLREHGNNKTACAKSLGITREGLHKKLRSFGL